MQSQEVDFESLKNRGVDDVKVDQLLEAINQAVRLELYDENFCSTVLDRLITEFDQLDPHQLINMIVGINKMGYSNKYQVETPVDRIQWNLIQFQARDISMLLSSCVVWGVDVKFNVLPFMLSLIENVRKLSLQDLVQCSWALSVLDACDSYWWEEVVPVMSSFSPNDWENVDKLMCKELLVLAKQSGSSKIFLRGLVQTAIGAKLEKNENISDLRGHVENVLYEMDITFQQDVYLNDYLYIDFVFQKGQGSQYAIILQDKFCFTVSLPCHELKIAQRRRKLVQDLGYKVITFEYNQWEQQCSDLQGGDAWVRKELSLMV
eukprot:TRINITY_DN25838_c0_g1_i3.p1 TRINITY_DN25838_c0_g1~~TRINITY_DN25838_c0_g1_i3.p1  ORF type:complete len:320 (-),score=45.04 TRINITY_DN25838_c0_g1_i3:73-1032(-)